MRDPQRRRNRRHLILAVAYAVALWGVCSIPGHAIPFSALWSWDKLWHLLGFAILFVLWRRAGYGALPVAAAAFGYGMAIELWQHYAPIGRFFDPLDVLANGAGVLVALLAYEAAGRLRLGRGAPATPRGG